MKIHILPVGFTPEVFTNSACPLVQLGADKIVTIHSPIIGQDIREKVNKVLEELKKRFPVPSEQLIVSQTSFMGFVREFIRLFDSFSEDDDIYVHIGGGERHLGLALVYASSFSQRKINLIPVLEYGYDTMEYKYALIPPLTPVELTGAQEKTLKLVLENPGKTLKELSQITNPDKPVNAAPSLFRHLRNLVDHRLISCDPNSRAYLPTELAPFFLS